MAKKKLLLNESVTRRFMKLAELKPTYVSNFLKEAEEEEAGMEEEAEEAPEAGEEDMEMEEEPDMEMGEEDMEMEEDAGGAEDLVMKLLSKVQEFAEEEGVDMEIAGDEEEGEQDMEDMDMEEEEGEEDMGMEEEPAMEEEGEANYGQANMGQANMYEAKRNLHQANVSVITEDNLINEVVKRVAKRLLMESKRNKNQRHNSNRRKTNRR
tara:strand:+ start:15263 stop:15892 length:630 start_codon:yes stop_codon:yes gene_type:complete